MKIQVFTKRILYQIDNIINKIVQFGMPQISTGASGCDDRKDIKYLVRTGIALITLQCLVLSCLGEDLSALAPKSGFKDRKTSQQGAVTLDKVRESREFLQDQIIPTKESTVQGEGVFGAKETKQDKKQITRWNLLLDTLDKIVLTRWNVWFGKHKLPRWWLATIPVAIVGSLIPGIFFTIIISATSPGFVILGIALIVLPLVVWVVLGIVMAIIVEIRYRRAIKKRVEELKPEEEQIKQEQVKQEQEMEEQRRKAEKERKTEAKRQEEERRKTRKKPFKPTKIEPKKPVEIKPKRKKTSLATTKNPTEKGGVVVGKTPDGREIYDTSGQDHMCNLHASFGKLTEGKSFKGALGGVAYYAEDYKDILESFFDFLVKFRRYKAENPNWKEEISESLRFAIIFFELDCFSVIRSSVEESRRRSSIEELRNDWFSGPIKDGIGFGIHGLIYCLSGYRIYRGTFPLDLYDPADIDEFKGFAKKIGFNINEKYNWEQWKGMEVTVSSGIEHAGIGHAERVAPRKPPLENSCFIDTVDYEWLGNKKEFLDATPEEVKNFKKEKMVLDKTNKIEAEVIIVPRYKQGEKKSEPRISNSARVRLNETTDKWEIFMDEEFSEKTGGEEYDLLKKFVVAYEYSKQEILSSDANARANLETDYWDPVKRKKRAEFDAQATLKAFKLFTKEELIALKLQIKRYYEESVKPPEGKLPLDVNITDGVLFAGPNKTRIELINDGLLQQGDVETVLDGKKIIMLDLLGRVINGLAALDLEGKGNVMLAKITGIDETFKAGGALNNMVTSKLVEMYS